MSSYDPIYWLWWYGPCRLSQLIASYFSSKWPIRSQGKSDLHSFSLVGIWAIKDFSVGLHQKTWALFQQQFWQFLLWYWRKLNISQNKLKAQFQPIHYGTTVMGRCKYEFFIFKKNHDSFKAKCHFHFLIHWVLLKSLW